MFAVKGLFTGLFIIGLIMFFGLWVNSQINLEVREINFTPSRIEVPDTKEHILSNQGIDIRDLTIEISEKPSVFSNRAYSWDVPKATEVKAMHSLVENELSEYTSVFLEIIGLDRIVLVDNIVNREGLPILGFSDPLLGDIYLNTVELEGRFSREVVAEQTIHHEIAHFLAYTEYGYWFDRESGWQELGSGELYGKVSTSTVEYFPEDGFVSRYGMTSPSEDFAEGYSLIYTEYFQEQLKDKAQGSELLTKKLELIYSTISSVDPTQCRTSFQAVDQPCD